MNQKIKTRSEELRFLPDGKEPSSLNYLFALSKPNPPNKRNMGVPLSCFGKPTGSIINTSNYPRKQSTGVHRGAQGSRKESIWESDQNKEPEYATRSKPDQGRVLLTSKHTVATRRECVLVM